MLHSFTLTSILIAAIVPGTVICEYQDEPVLVKINPFISKSKRIIQLGGDGRYKRNGPEKSALYLEFPDSFFDDPKLKTLYNSLTGIGSSEELKKIAKTDIVFKIDPSAFSEENPGGRHKKRDVRGEDSASFRVEVAPPIPRRKQMGRGLQAFVPRHETTKAWCMETMPDPEPCLPESPKPTPPPETTCHPSKPVTPKLRICGGLTTEDLRSARPNDPCQCKQTECTAEEKSTTPYDLYTQCKSQDPIVTHHVESLCWTTERCSPKATFMPLVKDVFSTTYKMVLKPSCPAQVPKCDSPFNKLFRRRRDKEQLRHFFSLSGSPPSCPPFCPPECTKSCSTTCSTTCPTTCSTPTTCACPPSGTTLCPDEFFPTTCSAPSTCSSRSTCCTTSKVCCPKGKREHADDPLRNVLRVFQRRNLRRARRNPPAFRRRRRVLVYKPKHRFRKVNFKSGGYASPFE